MKCYRIDGECTKIKFIKYLINSDDEITAKEKFLKLVMLQEKELKYILIKQIIK